jgi:hypothetical protein
MTDLSERGLPRSLTSACALLVAVLLIGNVASATPLNDPPVAVDDAYSTVQDDNLSVDDPGVLLNDTDPDDDPLTAILVDSSQASGQLFLLPDGQFEYEPATGFIGEDTFIYKANDGTADSNLAAIRITVTPSTGGGPIVFTNEASFMASLSASGYVPTEEGFEDAGTWGIARTPVTVPSVTSQGVTWTSNNATSKITTGSGPALNGMYGFYCLPHGNYDAGPQCATPGVCTDGWIATSPQPFVAFGGWVRQNGAAGSMNFILDGDTANPLDLGSFASWKFFGVIAPAGFNSIQFHEMEGKAEDQVIIFGDRFFFAFDGTNPWADLGSGLAGTDGVPQLNGTGTLVGGDAMSLQLTNALPTTPFTLVVGLVAVNAPFKGGVLVPRPDLLISGFNTDGAGAHVLGATWPPGVPPGAGFFFQDWVLDPAGPVGLSASNGLSGTTP